METEGKTLATARMRLAAIAAAHRLGGHEDPTTRPLVKATMKRLAKEYGKPRKQAKGLTSEALAEDTYTFMACTLGAPIPELSSSTMAQQWEREAGHPRASPEHARVLPGVPRWRGGTK